jgi:hypothetical protein
MSLVSADPRGVLGDKDPELVEGLTEKDFQMQKRFSLSIALVAAVFCVTAISTQARPFNGAEARTFQTVVRQALDAAPLNFSAIRGENVSETSWSADVSADSKYLRRCKVYDFTDNFMNEDNFKPYWSMACLVVIEHGGTKQRLEQIADEIAPAIPSDFTRQYFPPDTGEFSRNEKIRWSGPDDTYVIAQVYRRANGSLNEINIVVEHGPGGGD